MTKYISNTVESLNKFGDFLHKAPARLAKSWNQFKRSEIKPGDIVHPVDFENLTEKQISFLKSKDSFKVIDITDKSGQPWTEGIKFITIGYNIPLMLSRFQKIVVSDHDISKFDYRVLFIAFDIKLKTYGEEDVTKMFKGCETTTELFPKIFAEKLPISGKIPTTFTKFVGYDDIYRYQNEYFCEDVCLKEYDFIFFGFMASATNMATLLVNYAVRNKIPHMKYETYDYFHNKAYQFDLLETLGYPYIPSIMTTKLTKGIMKSIKTFGYPVIVKDVYKDRGEGVWKMKNEQELLTFFNGGYKEEEKKKEVIKPKADLGVGIGGRFSGYGGYQPYRQYIQPNKSLVLIQKYVPNDGEWRVITVKNKVVLIARKDAVEDIGKKQFDDRKSKKGELPADIVKMCEDVSTHLFSDIVGFDIIQDLNTKKYYIIETNASPHFAMFSVVTNVSVPEKITDYIISEIKTNSPRNK